MIPGRDATAKEEATPSSILHISSSQKSLLWSKRNAAAAATANARGREQEAPDINGGGNGNEEEEREREKDGATVSSLNLSIILPPPSSLLYTSLPLSAKPLGWRDFLFTPMQATSRLRQAREVRSQGTPSSHPFLTEGAITLPVIGQVKWSSVKAFAKEWLRNPKNLALALWGAAVGVSGAILFLVMVGFLDDALPSKTARDALFEVNNQILNALFTMMCLYMHPQRFLHLYQLIRWSPSDIESLREVYCKNGTYKPHEWAHMLVVVLLLHLNCFAQYALCGLNWGFRRSARPPIGVGLCLAVAIGAPAIAGLYSILSPLGKDYALEVSEDSPIEGDGPEAVKTMFEKKPSLKFGRPLRLLRKVSVMSKDGELIVEPEWEGGLLDCTRDPTVTFFSIFCGFCLFGWNMERLGFGNRYVHIVTFMLICTAPFWIFLLAATNIDNPDIRHGLTYLGVVLCLFGLLYGGYWRIRMRKTFGLPEQKWCFGKPALTDCTQWLFCSLCSLCQEVRTSEHYRIHENRFYQRKPVAPNSPLFTPSTRPLSSTPNEKEKFEEYTEIVLDKTITTPPSPPVLRKEGSVPLR